jgi:hypothetical protein
LAVEAEAGIAQHPSLGAKRLKKVDGQTAAGMQEDQRDSAVLVEKRFVELV